MLTSKQVAEELHTDERTARRFLRTVMPHQEHQRWEVPEESLDMIKLLWLVRQMGRDDMLKLIVR